LLGDQLTNWKAILGNEILTEKVFSSKCKEIVKFFTRKKIYNVSERRRGVKQETKREIISD